MSDLERFEQAGRDARAAGQMRAPALNPLVREALEGLPVGAARALEVMAAFTRGYDQAAIDAYREALS